MMKSRLGVHAAVSLLKPLACLPGRMRWWRPSLRAYLPNGQLCTTPLWLEEVCPWAQAEVAGEFLMLKHLASNGKADPDAHLKRSKAARDLAKMDRGQV